MGCSSIPPAHDSTIAQSVAFLLPFASLLHIGMALYMLGHPIVFPSAQVVGRWKLGRLGEEELDSELDRNSLVNGARGSGNPRITGWAADVQGSTTSGTVDDLDTLLGASGSNSPTGSLEETADSDFFASFSSHTRFL